jgi:hypothetical protein
MTKLDADKLRAEIAAAQARDVLWVLCAAVGTAAVGALLLWIIR